MVRSLRIEDIPALCRANCRIKDVGRVTQLIEEMKTGGVQRLQVVSDFDYTLTKQVAADGTPVMSSFGIFNACKSLPSNYIVESDKLFKMYRPIEIDPKIPTAEKTKYMIEWWAKSGDLLTGFPFDHSEIDEIAAKYKDSLRDRTHELFKSLAAHDVPVLVFSAGLGDSVVSVLKQANVMHPNVKVVSNFLDFDSNILKGLKEPIIHTFNKNETCLKGSEYYDLVHSRDHIIVMGDSLGDAGMADGVPSSSRIIKIGFLYHHVEENLDAYMNSFDIVLIDDQTMDVPNAIFNFIAL